MWSEKGKVRKNIRKMKGLRTGEGAEGRFFQKGKHRLQQRAEGHCIRR